MQLAFAVGVCIFLHGCKSADTASNTNTRNRTDLTYKEETKLKHAFMNGNKERVLGNLEAAVSYYNICLKIDPKQHAALYELARIYRRQGNDATALILAKQAVQYNGKNIWYKRLLARLYEKNGDYDKAIKSYEHLLQEAPEDVDLYFDIANIYLLDNDPLGAIKTFNRLEKKTGPNIEVLSNKQRLFVSMGKFKEAIAEVEKIIELYPDDVRYLGIRAELYQKSGDIEKALSSFKLILDVDPTNPYVHLSLSDLYRYKKQFDKQHQELLLAFENKKLGIDPKVSILLGYFSITGIVAGKKEQALDLCKALIQAHPKEAKAHSIYGDFLYRGQQLKDARLSYYKAVQLDDSKFVLWNQLLQISSELRDFNAVLENSNKALEIFPNQPILYLFQGIASIQKRQYSDAIGSLNNGKELVIEDDKLLGQFYANLGEAYYKDNNFALCDTAYEASFVLDPQNTFNLNNYSYYLSLRNDRLERAAELSKLCNEIQPNIPSFVDTYGWILYKQGKFSEAKTWIGKAMRFGGRESTTIVEHYGDILYKLDDINGALENWERAKALGSRGADLDYKIENKRMREK